ncbi:hypothetical protein H4582DRAFT_1902246 [Lactarius indigo]|nr:hypothetical protein H4582DRAFT_1902246 [Lactarius indigo]
MICINVPCFLTCALLICTRSCPIAANVVGMGVISTPLYLPHHYVKLVPVHFLTSTTSMAESSGSPTPSRTPDVIKLAAPLLFGPLVNWALYGVLCVQIYVYSYNFPKDKLSVKFLAYFVFVVETVQTALTGSDVYYWFVTGFGNVERLGDPHFGPIDISVITGIISLVVQGYFCYRIWVLSRWRSLWICWIIAINSVTQSVIAISLGLKSLIVRKYLTSKTGVYLWSISSAMADILIVVAMMLLLRRARSNFSNFVLIRVVRLTIETNALTATLAITGLVLYAAFPDELYILYVSEIIGKLYSNTLLVSLNNRIYFREHQAPENDDNAITVSVRVRAATQSSLSFAVPEPQSRTPTGDNFRLCTISQKVESDSDESRGDDIDVGGATGASVRPAGLVMHDA